MSHRINERAAAGDVVAVEQLLRQGWLVSHRDQYDETPLHRAAWEGHLPVVELLLSWGADRDSRAGTGKTPLHRAARQDHRDIAARLLRAGARCDPVTRDGQTPLHWACFSGAAAVAELLLAWGADAGVRDAAGRRPADVARARGHDRLEARLEAAARGQPSPPARGAPAGSSQPDRRGQANVRPAHEEPGS